VGRAVDQALDMRRLVDVVVTAFANLAKSLYARRQFAPHGRHTIPKALGGRPSFHQMTSAHYAFCDHLAEFCCGIREDISALPYNEKSNELGIALHSRHPRELPAIWMWPGFVF